MVDSIFPRMLLVRQKFPPSTPIELEAVLSAEFSRLMPRVQAGMRVAVGVGSRGIANLQTIIRIVVERLRGAGAEPFLVPAMGSHGGATAEGQANILEHYGVSAQELGVPVRADMATERVGLTEDGLEVFCSRAALACDGLLLVNRIKPHTDFRSDTVGSGLLKMLVVGLGKQAGAASYHAAAARHGHATVLASMGEVLRRKLPLLGGIAVVENQLHQTVCARLLLGEEIPVQEAPLLAQAVNLMPGLPFDTADLLVVDEIGKDLSGTGMDPAVIGRSVHGYSTDWPDQARNRPAIRRILVRDLSSETQGNAIGIGLADFTTTRVVRAMDTRKTFLNCLTSLSLNAPKLPIYFEDDAHAMAHALASLGLKDNRQARVIRIANTLRLERLQVSEAFAPLLNSRSDLEVLEPAGELQWDAQGNLERLLG